MGPALRLDGLFFLPEFEPSPTCSYSPYRLRYPDFDFLPVMEPRSSYSIRRCPLTLVTLRDTEWCEVSKSCISCASVRRVLETSRLK